MKNYYEILGLDLESSKTEIKKAYFSLVRKYPPDRLPKEFMQIREAYETLSNEKTRSEYDMIVKMPPQTKQLFDMAQKDIQDDNPEGAIELLEKTLKYNPDILLVHSLLGEAYLMNGNTGKAAKIFEELVSKMPDNPSFKGRLAKAYLERGWHKKAMKAYEEAIELDPDNISLWLGLAETYEIDNNYKASVDILQKALEKGTENNWDNITIYFHLIHAEIILNRREELKKHLKDLTDLAITKEDLRENVGWTLGSLASALSQAGYDEAANETIARAVELMPDDKNILKLKSEVEKNHRVMQQLPELKKDNINEELVQIIEMEIMPFDVLGFDIFRKEAYTFMAELYILENYLELYPSILKLKEKYPDLYDIKADFFNNASNTKKRNRMLNSYRFKRKMYDWIFEEDDEYYDDEEYEEDDYDDYGYYEPQQPYIREEPKIGRNDPCPCGSGKKYKKCCGK